MLRIILLVVCLGITIQSNAAIIVVDVDGSGDYANIQDAIDIANNDDVVLVSDGIYTGLLNRNLDFGGRAITVTSENGPEVTIIDCEYGGRGFRFHSNEDPNSVVSGFTITNGSANIITHSGGGILCDASSPTIDNCIIVNNLARGSNGFGGGIACIDCSPIITNCVISNNTTNSHGGGIYCRNSSPTIKYTEITHNTVEAYGNGAGVCCYIGVVTISNSIIANNKGESIGGSIFSGNRGRSIVDHCTIVGNISSRGAALGEGSSTISNSIIWGHESLLYRPKDLVVSYSNVQGGMPGEGNINIDPSFVAPENEDYHLLQASSCIDAGDPIFLAGHNETDFDGNPRVINGKTDMGAYEYNPPITAEVDLTPKTLNLSSEGNWMACNISLPEGFDVSDIETDSILLEDEIQAESVLVNKQQHTITAKFSRSSLEDILLEFGLSGDVELTVTGNFIDSTWFKGTTVIRVL